MSTVSHSTIMEKAEMESSAEESALDSGKLQPTTQTATGSSAIQEQIDSSTYKTSPFHRLTSRFVTTPPLEYIEPTGHDYKFSFTRPQSGEPCSRPSSESNCAYPATTLEGINTDSEFEDSESDKGCEQEDERSMRRTESASRGRPNPSTGDSDGAQSIADATNACRNSFTRCPVIEGLGINWAEDRLADFKLWDASVGASSNKDISLDKRLGSKPHIRNVVVDLLTVLESTIDQCRVLGIRLIPLFQCSY